MPDKASDVVTLNLRLSKSLHRKLTQEAKRRGVSLNTLINNQLGGPPTTPTTAAFIEEVAKAAVESTRPRDGYFPIDTPKPKNK